MIDQAICIPGIPVSWPRPPIGPVTVRFMNAPKEASRTRTINAFSRLPGGLEVLTPSSVLSLTKLHWARWRDYLRKLLPSDPEPESLPGGIWQVPRLRPDSP